MTNYTKATNFAAKDSLASGNAAKVVKGTEIDTEFTNIETAVNSKSDSANPVFTGVAEFADGSASAPSITNTGDTNTGMFFPAADTIAFAEGGTEAMRLDSSGNLGLGVTPSAWSGSYKAIEFPGISVANLNGGTNQQAQYLLNAYDSGAGAWKYKITGAGAAMYRQAADGSHEWHRAGTGTAGNAISFTQAMTLDASGNLLVGTTSLPLDSSVAGVSISKAGVGAGQARFGKTYSGLTTAIYFGYNTTTVGTVTYSDTATAYNTSSDYRLKENIQQMRGALDTVARLKPVTYTWKADGSSGQGFIAHELQEVVPDCVTGEKDAVETYIDKDGNEQNRPVYQGIDTSFLVATLTAAIQELKAELDAAKARITALEA